MKERYARIFSGLLLVFLLLALSTGWAEDKHHDSGAMGKMSGHHKNVEAGKSKHGFMPHWAKTLTDDQKLIIDQMHLDVIKQQNMLDAEVSLRQQELNQLVIADLVDKKALQRKIDQIMTLKGRLLRIRFEHIAEMRAALTIEQRLSYDMGVLKRDSRRH